MNDKGLIYSLICKPDPLWINKALPAEDEHPIFTVAFEVKWPNRSVWEGKCPTAQEFEFIIKRTGFDKIIWSKDLIFPQIITPVYIPGPTSKVYKAQWELNPDEFIEEGIYTLEATFIAADHKVKRDFEVKFAI